MALQGDGGAKRPINVGIIGVSPDRGWGLHAHIPAIKAVPGLELKAVATSREESARAAADALGAPLSFGNAMEMIQHPEIDMITIAVRVPYHREYAIAALAAGKHVYCEWPLGNGLAEAEEMAAAARVAKGRAAVGLQGRSSPYLGQVRDLIAQGYIGKVLSSSMVISAEHFLDVIPEEFETLLDPQFGMTMVTIHYSHVLDMLCRTLGEFESLTANATTLRTQMTVAETGKVLPNLAPDHMAVGGILRSGAVASINMRGGHSRGTNAYWEINGTGGDLVITTDFGNLHIPPLKVEGGRGDDLRVSVIPLPSEDFVSLAAGLVGPPANVAEAYAALVRDIRTGSRDCPDFEDALLRHKALEATQVAFRTGTRQSY